jgi:1-carboxybiuret hydrolase subunit AtzG-like protein
MAKTTRPKRKKNRPAKPAKRPRRAAASAGTKSVAKAKRKTRANIAPKPADVIDTLVAANAQALSLRIDPAWRASVKRNLHVILTHAALVDQFPLSDDIEQAPVFRA